MRTYLHFTNNEGNEGKNLHFTHNEDTRFIMGKIKVRTLILALSNVRESLLWYDEDDIYKIIIKLSYSYILYCICML